MVETWNIVAKHGNPDKVFTPIHNRMQTVLQRTADRHEREMLCVSLSW